MPPRPARPARPAPPVKTEAQLQAEKRRRDLRNINITLYSASLLLVAAAALFIGLAIPAGARFLGVVGVTALFYVSGLVVHARSRRLRPAAVAFTGTGLALIPVVGLALHTVVLQDGPAAWLITSLAGTVAFAFAAARIDSRVVTYLALTFLLSSGLASGAVLRSGIIWYFLFTVVLATLISLAAIRRPKWLNNLYLDAFVRSHRYLVPAAAIAAVQISRDLTAGQLSILFLAFALHYAVMMWQGPARNQLANSYGLRAAGTVGLTALCYSFTGSTQATLLAFAIQIAAQLSGILLRKPVYGAAALLQIASRTAGLPLDEGLDAEAAAGRRGAGTTGVPSGGQAAGGAVPRRGTPDPAPAAGGVSLAKKPAVEPEIRARRFFRTDVAALLVMQAATGLAAGLFQALGTSESSGSTMIFSATILVVLGTYLAAARTVGGLLEFAAIVPLGLSFVPHALLAKEPLWPSVLVTAALTAYLMVRARGEATRMQFVLGARAAGVLLLPLTVLASVSGAGGADGWSWALLTAVVAMAANQTASVIRVSAGKPEYVPGWVILASATGTAAGVLVLCFEPRLEPTHAVAALWVLVAVNILTTLRLARSRFLTAGPLGFIAAALMGAGLLGVRGYELLVAAALVYCVLMVRKFGPRGHRTFYIAVGQVLITVLTGLAAADLGMDVHGIFTALAASLAVQHLARIVLHRRLRPLGLARTFMWATLTALSMTAPAYYILTDTAARPETGLALLVIAVTSALITQGVAAFTAAGRSRVSPDTGAAAVVPVSGPVVPVSGPVVPAAGPFTTPAPAVRPRAAAAGPDRGAGHAALAATTAASALALLLSVSVRTVDATDGTVALAVLAGALALNILTALLLRHSWPVLLAPAGFVATAATGAGLLGVRGYQVLVSAALIYCVYFVLGRTNPFRGAYLLAAQVLLIVLAALVTADLTGEIHSVFAAAAVGIAVCEVLRVLFAHQLEPLGLAGPAQWGSLCAAGTVALAYVVLMGSGRQDGTLMFLLTTAAAVAVLIQLSTAMRVRRGTALPFAAALMLSAGLIVVIAAAASRGIDAPVVWSLALIWGGLAANIAISLVLLRFASYEVAAPAGFTAAAMLGGGVFGIHGYEVLALAALAYCASLALNRELTTRGLYLLGIQALVVLLSVLAAVDLGAGRHGTFVAGTAVLAAQHIIRTLLDRHFGNLGYAEVSGWVSLCLLLLAPLGYAINAGPGVRRGVVTVQLILLLLSATVAFIRWNADRQPRSQWVIYIAGLALGTLPVVLTRLPDFDKAGLLPEPVLSPVAAGATLLALAAAGLWGEFRHTLEIPLRTALLSISAAYTAAALFLAAASGSALLAAAVFGFAGALFLALSFSRQRPWLAVGLPPLVAAGMLFLSWSTAGSALGGLLETGYAALVPAWAAAAVLLAIRLLIPGHAAEAGAKHRDGVLRRHIIGAGASLILTLAAVPAMAPDASAAAGSLTLAAALGVGLIEMPARFREPAVQAAALLTALAVQRIAWLLLGDVNGFWSLQYWACVLAGLAAYEYLRKRENRGTIVLAAAAAILSLSGLSTIISGGAGKQLWALVAHAGLLAFGLLASRRLFTLWGAAGVVLAVLWYLRGYTFLWLALLGIGLIALAVWRLTRVRSDEPERKDSRGEGEPGPENAQAGPAEGSRAPLSGAGEERGY
ncbi:hypothetical protein [Arthrobacter sp. YD2]|uniref:hypothetical protein n=1 Tax=Arthrobacter sp. YD2 TaxID=3058046 RepID=UPI0025B454BC|nr:hypothetical protein [Arthrobacter sp. YD2]MDN3903769.1 hypothetical protein [Arthrobacter sp. YD2]